MVTAGKELTQAVSHRLVLEGRNMLSITGVTDAVSFDEAAAVLETAGGTLIIRGAELHVEQLNLEAGEVRLSGRVDSLVYEENTKTQGGFFFCGQWRWGRHWGFSMIWGVGSGERGAAARCPWICCFPCCSCCR